MSNDFDIRDLVKKITLAPDEQALSGILSALEPQNITRPVQLAFVNAHALNLSAKNRDFLHHLMQCDYVFRDGSGMKILYKMLGTNPGLNLNGTDLIPRIIKLYEGENTSLFGTQHPYLDRAAKVIRENGAMPVLILDGFQDDEEYLDAARKYPASLIILAMGMPKQERISELLASRLDYPCLIICGGAILDFLGGKVTRAPMLFRRLGMEWVYRLIQEPRRLFRRYIIGNVVFLLRSVALALPSVRSRQRSTLPQK